jgi:hypothetical protein
MRGWGITPKNSAAETGTGPRRAALHCGCTTSQSWRYGSGGGACAKMVGTGCRAVQFLGDALAELAGARANEADAATAAYRYTAIRHDDELA